MLSFSDKQSKHAGDTERSLFQQNDLPDDSFSLETSYEGTKIVGHITNVSFDLLQVEIDSPYSGLKDGYCNDVAQLTEEYWYVKNNRLTEFCREDAKNLLVELYQAAYLFDHERHLVQKALLDGIELAHDYYPNNGLPVVEAYEIEQNGKLHKITDLDELAKMTDKRPFEEQRDFFILNRILDRLYFDYQVWAKWDVLTQLVKKCFGVSLVYPNRLEKIIHERLEKLQINK